MTLTIDGKDLTIDAVVLAARGNGEGHYPRVTLNSDARANLQAARDYVDRHWMTDDAPLMYAFNTGVGVFKDKRIPVSDMAEFQRNLILSHATGIGDPLAEEVVRATMLLRANAFASNYSAVSLPVLDRLIAFLNEGLHPIVPQKGSVGASGDLAPLAHLCGALCGYEEAEIIYQGRRQPAQEALAKAGMEASLPLGAKDASAVINGSTVSLALAVLAAHDARRLLKNADIALALSLEAMRCEQAAFDPRLHAARPHPGQGTTAANLRRLLAGSKRMTQGARDLVFPGESRQAGTPASARVQDVYSLRCAPQVHGPVRDALGYIEGILGTEINSATDNPLMFDDGGGDFTVISGGHFHGAYLAQAMDLLAIAVADLGAISERRLARLIDPVMSLGLPRNLTSGRPGLNTGYATVQCSMSALVMENRGLATPGSVDSIPGKGNAEDHVSNSTWCARKAATIVENAERIVAVEMLCAAQGLSLVEPLAGGYPLGSGTAAAFAALRERIAPGLDGDRWFAKEMDEVCQLMRSGAVVEAVEEAVGPLD